MPATKCDDVACSEVIRALNLQGDDILEDIEARIEANIAESKTFKKEKTQSEKLVKGRMLILSWCYMYAQAITAISKEMDHLRACVKEHEEHLDCLRSGQEFTPKLTTKKATKNSKKRKNIRGGKKGSPKRRRANDSDSDDDSELDGSESETSNSDVDSDDDSDNSDFESGSDDESGNENEADQDNAAEVTEDILKDKIATLRTTLKDARARHSTARQQKKDAADALGRLSKALAKLQREKNGFCSLKRSEVRSLSGLI